MKYIAPAVNNVHSALNLIQGQKSNSHMDSTNPAFSTASAYEADE